MENSSWKIQVGKFNWKIQVGKCKLENASWKIQVGKCKLENSSWKIQVLPSCKKVTKLENPSVNVINSTRFCQLMIFLIFFGGGETPPHPPPHGFGPVLHLCQYVFPHVKPPWQPPNHSHLLLRVSGMHCRIICRPPQLFLFLEELSNIIYSCLLTLTVLQILV